MATVPTSPRTPSVHKNTSLLSRRRWLQGTKNGIVFPLKIRTAEEDDPSTAKSVLTSATTLVAPASSVKAFIPSLSMFNLPSIGSSSKVLSPKPTKDHLPPPQFAIDHSRRRHFINKLKPRKRGLQKAYPSAFETYLFDDAHPGHQDRGIQPVRLLVERLEAWHLLAKRLLHHFELLASIETCVAKTYRQMDRVQPLKSRRPIYKKKRFYKDERLMQVHFAFEGGVRSVCEAWQEHHLKTANEHSDYATLLRNDAIPTLSNIQRELKWMIKSIQADDRLSLATLTKLKQEAAKRLKRLDRQLVFFDEHPYHGHSKKDPWLLNAAVVKQMIKVYRQENRIHETVLRLQHEAHLSESHLVDELRRLCDDTTTSTASETETDDWTYFLTHHQQQLIPETASFRHPDHLQYPNHTHPLLQPIFAARMEKRHTLFNYWNEYIYVLTPAGYLHEFRNTTHYPHQPDRSIYVPHFKVCAISATHLHHSLVFELQPHRASRQKPALGYPRVKHRWGVLLDRWTWTLRAKSVEDLEMWVRCLSECSQRIEPSVLIMKQPAAQPETVAEIEKPEETKEEVEEGKEEPKAEDSTAVVTADVKAEDDESPSTATVTEAEPTEKVEEAEAVPAPAPAPTPAPEPESESETKTEEKEAPTPTDDKEAKADNLVIE